MPSTTSTLLSLSPLSASQGGTGLASLGSGVAAFLGTPSSTNLLAAVTGETGTGGVVFQLSPALSTPTITGITSGTNPAAGLVGETISSSVLSASAISLTSTISANITFIDITAGNWHLFGNVYLAGASNLSAGLGWINTVSATLPDESLRYYVQGVSMSAAGGCVPGKVISITSTTRYYLSAFANFPAGSIVASGSIYAHRIV